MINKQTAGKFLGASRVPATTHPLLQAQYERKNDAVVKHQENLQSDLLVKALRDSTKPFVASVRSGNTALATLLSKDVTANENQLAATRNLVSISERAYNKPAPALINAISTNSDIASTIAKHADVANDIATRQVISHGQERKEDLGEQLLGKRRDMLRNDLLLKIEKHVNPRQTQKGWIESMFGGIKVVGGAVVGATALGLGKMVKMILTGQAFQLAGASVVGISRFFSDTVKFVAKPLGLTNAAGSKIYFGSLVKKLPVIGAVLKGIYGAFDAIGVMASPDKVGALLGVDSSSVHFDDKMAAGIATFLNDLSFGLADTVAKALGFENTARMIKAGFDKAKDWGPSILAVVDSAVAWADNAVVATGAYLTNEIQQFQAADSVADYLKGAGQRLSTAVMTSSAVTYAQAMVTTVTDAVKDYFTTEDVTPDGTVIRRQMNLSESIDKLKGLASEIAHTAGMMIGTTIDSVVSYGSKMVDDLFKTQDVAPDGTVVARYMNTRELSDKIARFVEKVGSSLSGTVLAAIDGVLSNGMGEADTRTLTQKINDALKRGFDVVSAGVVLSIDTAYTLVADAFSAMLTKSAEGVDISQDAVKSVLGTVVSGIGSVFVAGVKALGNRVLETVTSKEFVQGAIDAVHAITSNIFEPLTVVAIATKGMSFTGGANLVEDAFKGITKIGEFLTNMDRAIARVAFSMRTFQHIVTGFEETKQLMQVGGDLKMVVVKSVEMVKNVENTFFLVRKVADFFDGIAGVVSKFSGVFKMLGNVGGLVAKVAWPLQILFGVIDFFSGFGDELTSQRLGIDPSKLNLADKIGSGLGSVMKGLVGLPMDIINWLGRKILGDDFNIGDGEDVAKYVASTVHKLATVIMGNGSVGDVAEMFFRGVAGVPWAIGGAILRNLFGVEIGSVEEVGGAIKGWVDTTVGKIKNIDLGEILTKTFSDIGNWFADVFSFTRIKNFITKSIQQMPGGQAVLELMGVTQPAEAAAVVGSSQTPQAASNTMAIVKPQYDKWEQDKIRAAEKNDVATIEKLEKQQAELLRKNGLKADSQGNLTPDTSYKPAPPVYQALGGVWGATGQIKRYALGGVDDIVSKPTIFPTASGRALVGEAGYPEAIMPLQRMPNGKLGVHAVIPPWPKELDFKNVTFNLDDKSSRSFADQLTDAFSRAWGTISGLANSAMTGVQGFVNNTVKPRVSAAVGSTPDTKTAATSVAQMIAQATGADENEVLAAIGNAQIQAGSGLTQVQAHMSNLFKQGSDALNSPEALNKISDALSKVTGKDPNEIHASLGNLMLDLKKGLSSTGETLDKVIPQAPDRLHEFLSRMGEKLGAGKESFVKVFEKTKAKMPDAPVKDIFKAMGFEGDAVGNAFTSVKQDLGNVNVGDWLSKKTSDISTSLNAAGTQVGNAVSNGYDTAKSGVNSLVNGIDQYMSQVHKAESSGKDNLVSDTGATGRYQFTMGTWNDITKKHAKRLKELGIDNPRLATKNNKWNPNLNDPRYDVKAQEAYMRILTENNAKQMGTDDPGALYLAHFMGAGSAKKIIQAVNNGQGGANALSLLSDQSKQDLTTGKTNNSVTGGKTAEQMLAWARKKMNQTGTYAADTYQGVSNATSNAYQTTTSAASSVWDSIKNEANSIKQSITGPDGSMNWTADTAAAYFGKLHGFGADTTGLVASIMAGGNAKAASTQSAMLGGQGTPTESFGDFNKYGKPDYNSADLAQKRLGMMKMLGRSNPNSRLFDIPKELRPADATTGRAQMVEDALPIRRPMVTNEGLPYRRPSMDVSNPFSPPASARMESPTQGTIPTYGDKINALTTIRTPTQEQQGTTTKVKNNPSAAQQVLPPGPSADGPNIDAIPIFISDMGLILVNHFTI